MLGVLNMQDDVLCRVSHVEPGMKAKVFFKKLNDDMNNRVSELIDQINALG